MERKIIPVEARVPLLPSIPLSLQHLFAMFGSTVLVPFLLHVDPATALFMNGVGTLLYLWICQWKLPAYLGSSFAFISPVLAVCGTAGLSYGDAQGGFIAFGLCFMALAFLVKKVGTRWIDVLFPPAAMGSVVAIIGLELAPLAMSMAGYVGEVQGMSAGTACVISTFTLAVTVLAAVLGRGFLGIIPILICVVSGYALSFCLGVVDLSGVEAAPWFAFPTFYKPEFDLRAILMILPALFVVFAILFSFMGKFAALIHAIPTPVMGGVCVLLFGFIAASGMRMFIEKHVDFTRSKNLILCSVTMISGLSGATVILGPVQLKGMGLATVVAMGLSLIFLVFQKLHMDNEQQ